ncbi:MAG: DMT family transporter [Vulcanimicrobiaceae bacterium]
MQARARGPVGVAIAIFYIFLWASAYVPSKIASTQSQALWFLVARFETAGAIMVLIALAARQRFPNDARTWFVAGIVGVLGNALYLGLTYAALHHLSSGMGAIVASTNPLVLALVAPRLLGERLTPLKALGLALGFGGVVAIVFARTGSGDAAPADVLVALLGVCASVASTLLYKRTMTGESALAVNAIQLLVAGLVIVPVALVAPPFAGFRLTAELVASFAYLVLALSVGASLIWFWLLTHGEASRVSAFYYLTPAFGLAIAAALLHERVGAHDLLGLAAIAGGIALVQRA